MQPRTTTTLSRLVATTVLVMLAGCATSPAATVPPEPGDAGKTEEATAPPQ